MSYKSENWKEKLEQVRNHIALKEGSVEKSADDILNDQIEESLNSIEEDVVEVQEVTDKEINAVKKLSKLIEKAKKDYFKIAKMGDKTLKDTKFNEKYESILKAQQEILSLIGELETQKIIDAREEVEVDLDEKEMSSGEVIKKLFKLKNDKQISGVANLLNMTDAKVLKGMQKQNPKGFLRMAEKMGELPAMEEVEVQESVEKTTEKLVERNMLGRLAKQLQRNEEGKQKMFDYFEKGE